VTSILLDMCAIGAFIIGMVNGSMWPVLGIGYFVTAFGGLFAVFMVFRQLVYYRCWHSSVLFLALSVGTIVFITSVGASMFVIDCFNLH